jgi:hypothetical protein
MTVFFNEIKGLALKSNLIKRQFFNEMRDLQPSMKVTYEGFQKTKLNKLTRIYPNKSLGFGHPQDRHRGPPL